MISFPTAVIRGFLPALLLIGCLAAAGCASDRPGRGPSGRGPRPAPIPNLVGQEKFFDGQITAEVRVGALAGFDRGGEGAARTPGDRPRRYGGGGEPGGPGGGGPGMRPPGEMGGDEARPAMGMRPTETRAAPPVAIHLRFTNHGTAPVDLAIVDFLSPLGNFVVQPSTLRLEPGQSAAVEPMASRLAGEVASGEITLKLQIGGSRESKTIVLQREATGPESGNSGQSL